jgi:putative serine protease PepD
MIRQFSRHMLSPLVLGALLLGCSSPDPVAADPSEGSAASSSSSENPSGVVEANDPSDRGYAPVRLGIRPGMGGDDFGVRVNGVSDGTSAAEGGIMEGDIIVAWGGEDLIDVMDMVVRLREHRPGDVVQMVVLRDGEEIELDITMKASNRAMEN